MRFLSTALLVVVTAAAGLAGATVRMSESAVVDGARVTLGDVAVVDTMNAAERARLSGVVVAFLGAGETSTVVDSDAVRQALSGAGVNLAYVNVAGAASVAVSRANGALATATLAKTLEESLSRLSPEGLFSLSDISMDFPMDGHFSPVVLDARPKDLSGRVRFDLADASAPDEVIGHAFATVTRTRRVVVAKRSIMTGRTLSAADLALETRPVAQCAGGIDSIEDAVGRRTLSTFEPENVLREGLLASDEVVRRGDEVLLEYVSETMTVAVRTKALENAAVGDVARLKRDGDRSEYLGRITGAGRAVPVSGGVQ